MAGDIIGVPTQFTGISLTSVPGSGQTTPFVYPVLQIAGGSQVTLASNVSVIFGSGDTLTLSSTQVSWRTVAGDSSVVSLAASNPDNGQLALVFRASGLSLVYRSGNSIYHFNSAASGAAV